MTTPTFPVLAGQGYSVKKRPTMSTIVAPHVSGREVRAQLYQNPIWQFEMPFYLDGTATGQYGALGAQSMQSLLGLFLQCGGQFGTFLYYDPTDYLVTNQQFGVGDGATTAFQLTRSINGVFTENVAAAYNPGSLATIPAQGNPWPPNNSFAYSNALSSALTPLTNVTLTTGQSDPFGGALAVKIAETTANGAHAASEYPITLPGPAFTFSCYLKKSGNQYWGLIPGVNGLSYFTASVDLTNGLIYPGAGVTAGIIPLSGGWYRCWVSGAIGSTTMFLAEICGINNIIGNFGANYVGSTSNSVFMAFPQVETLAAPGPPTAFNPTGSSAYVGTPAIFVNGVLQTSGYTISNGVVTFGTAPTAAAILTWSGVFGFLCRFDDDSVDFDQFMSNLWQVESLKFRSVRAQ